MYHQILVQPSQTRDQRIVFRNHPTDDLKDFELKTVTCGANCAPYLAIRMLHQLASDVKDHWPLASKNLRRMMYFLSYNSDKLILVLSSVGFSLKKWTSNDERILYDLPYWLNRNFLEIDEHS